jgi:hypothetical protein
MDSLWFAINVGNVDLMPLRTTILSSDSMEV